MTTYIYLKTFKDFKRGSLKQTPFSFTLMSFTKVRAPGVFQHHQTFFFLLFLASCLYEVSQAISMYHMYVNYKMFNLLFNQ